MGSLGTVFGDSLVQLASVLNHIDEALLDNNTYLTTEEGYLIAETDNCNNLTISED